MHHKSGLKVTILGVLKVNCFSSSRTPVKSKLRLTSCTSSLLAGSTWAGKDSTLAGKDHFAVVPDLLFFLFTVYTCLVSVLVILCVSPINCGIMNFIIDIIFTIAWSCFILYFVCIGFGLFCWSFLGWFIWNLQQDFPIIFVYSNTLFLVRMMSSPLSLH